MGKRIKYTVRKNGTRETTRSFSAAVDRSHRIDEMMKSSSNYRQVFTLLSVGAVIGIISNLFS